MLISNADMLYYTDPIPTSFVSTKAPEESIYVTMVTHARHRAKIGTVMKVRKGTADHLGTRWRVTTEGDYVAGHVVNPNLSSTGRTYVGKILADDDTWLAGQGMRNDSGDFRELRDARFSDGRQLTGIFGFTETQGVTFWLPGAQWAVDLMPVPSDTAEVARQKIALAKARWEMNRAVAHVENEGRYRHWDEGLKELHDSPDLGWLPSPYFNVFVEGTALIRTEEHPASPRTEDLPEFVRSSMEKLDGGSLTSARRVDAPSYPVPVTFAARVEATRENLNLTSLTSRITTEFNQRFRGANASLGAYTATPYVSGLDTYL